MSKCIGCPAAKDLTPDEAVATILGLTMGPNYRSELLSSPCTTFFTLYKLQSHSRFFLTYMHCLCLGLQPLRCPPSLGQCGSLWAHYWRRSNSQGLPQQASPLPDPEGVALQGLCPGLKRLPVLTWAHSWLTNFPNSLKINFVAFFLFLLTLNLFVTESFF